MSDGQPKPTRRVTPREKSALSPKSAKLAIAAHCYHDCHNEEETNSHTTKVAIRDCPQTACALWPHRGWQKVTGGTLKQRESGGPQNR